MALYLGNSENLKIILGGITYCLNLSAMQPVVKDTRLISYDNYILKDANGLYLSSKEDE